MFYFKKVNLNFFCVPFELVCHCYILKQCKLRFVRKNAGICRDKKNQSIGLRLGFVGAGRKISCLCAAKVYMYKTTNAHYLIRYTLARKPEFFCYVPAIFHPVNRSLKLNNHTTVCPCWEYLCYNR